MTNRVFSSFNHLTAFDNFISSNSKSHISASSVHKYHKWCSQLIWPFYSLLQPYEQKFQKSPISVSSVHKYHKSCTQLNWLFYGFLQLYEKKIQKSHNSVC